MGSIVDLLLISLVQFFIENQLQCWFAWKRQDIKKNCHIFDMWFWSLNENSSHVGVGLTVVVLIGEGAPTI